MSVYALGVRTSNVIFLLVSIVLFDQKIYALGSLDTTLTGTDKAQYITTHWTFDNGATCKGNVTFTNGFSVYPGGTLNYESVGIASNHIYLNGGTINLTGDMYLGKVTVIHGPGTFIAPSYCALFFLDSTSITGGQVTMIGYVALVGTGTLFSIDNSTGGVLRFLNTNAYIHNIRFYGVKSSSFITYDAPYSAYLYLHNVSFNINAGDTLLFNARIPYSNMGVNIIGDCEISGPSSQAIFQTYVQIEEGASLTMNQGTVATFAPSPDPTYGGGIIFMKPSSIFTLNSARMEVDTYMQFRNGCFGIEGSSTIAGLGGNRLDIGDGANIANDNHFFIEPGATVNIENGTEVRYQNIH